jgi:hypothetical protein
LVAVSAGKIQAATIKHSNASHKRCLETLSFNLDQLDPWPLASRPRTFRCDIPIIFCGPLQLRKLAERIALRIVIRLVDTPARLGARHGQ